MKGVIFNIQKFSVHDGVGIRTMIFLKGCPLRCQWCSNPESHSLRPELAHNPTRCLGPKVCGLCARVCPHGAIAAADGLVAMNRQKCRECLACARACPAGARIVYGEEHSVDDILRRVEEDSLFYSRSGGGLTLSGGEAMFQPEFALAILSAAQKQHLDRAMETCGHCSYEHLRAACGRLSLLIYDLKHLDSQAHTNGTGVGNELILENFLRICAEFPELPILVRTPLVPGFNDNPETVRAILDCIPRRPGIRYELLPYHRMGLPKYHYLGRDCPMGDLQVDKQLELDLLDLAGSFPNPSCHSQSGQS